MNQLHTSSMGSRGSIQYSSSFCDFCAQSPRLPATNRGKVTNRGGANPMIEKNLIYLVTVFPNNIVHLFSLQKEKEVTLTFCSPGPK